MSVNDMANIRWFHLVCLIMIIGSYVGDCHQDHKNAEHFKKKKHISEEREMMNNNRNHPRRGHRKKNRHHPEDDLSVWINEQHLKTLTGNFIGFPKNKRNK